MANTNVTVADSLKHLARVVKGARTKASEYVGMSVS